jgi:hypothetical protein
VSHADYVAKCDEDQLKNLIERAEARLTEIRSSGWVKLWTVQHGWANVAWFSESNYGAAVSHMFSILREEAAKPNGRGFSLELSLEKYRPEEVGDLIKVAAPELGEQEGGKSHG